MYSWRMIRTFCVALLCLPLIHLVILMSQDMAALLDSSPTTWQDEMETYVQLDAHSTLPANPVLVTGGRRVAIWPHLDRVVAPGTVLERPLGEATVKDIIFYHDRLISHYQPRVIVLAMDNSELQLRANNTPNQMLDNLKQLAELTSVRTTPRLFYIVLPVKTVFYSEDHATIEEASTLIKDWARGQRGIRVLDPNPELATATGLPDPAFFRTDGVQLNDAGYLRMSYLLRHQLSLDYPGEYLADNTP